MELVSAKDFEAWAAERQIGRDPAYPHSPSLTYAGEAATWYRYRQPAAEPLATFAERAVRVAAAGDDLWLYPPARSGAWSIPAATDVPSLAALVDVIREAGVPAGHAGAIRCAVSEAGLVASLFAAALEHADCFWELAVVPTHRQCVIQSEEDGDIIGHFPSEARCASYTAALRRAGWADPTEPDPRVSATDPWLGVRGG